MIFSSVLRFLILYTPMPPSVSNEEHSMMSSDWLRVALLLHALWQYIQGIIYMTFLVPPYRTLFVRHAIRDSASPRPKMYWTRTFEELVSSLDTTSNLVLPF